MFQLPEDDGVAEMNVGSRRIYAEIGAERLSSFKRVFELRLEFGFRDDFGRAFF